MLEGRVSVIMPCYNAGHFLLRAMESVLTQTWSNLELIVVDDGSSDNTCDVVRASSDRRVRLLTQRNRGAGAARNLGLSEARGAYLQFLDADDLLSREKIAAQIEVLEISPAGKLAISNTKYFQSGESPDEGILHDGWPMIDTDNPIDWLIQLHGDESHPTGGMVHPGAWLIPRSIAEAAGPWDEVPSPDDDGEYFARVVLASTGIRRSTRGLSYYRKHRIGAGNLSAEHSAAYQRAALRSLEVRADMILARDSSPRARKAFARCFRSRAFTAYPFDKHTSEMASAKARELGDRRPIGEFGTWKGRFLARILGWKLVRRANVAWHAAGRHRRTLR